MEEQHNYSCAAERRVARNRIVAAWGVFFFIVAAYLLMPLSTKDLPFWCAGIGLFLAGFPAVAWFRAVKNKRQVTLNALPRTVAIRRNGTFEGPIKSYLTLGWEVSTGEEVVLSDEALTRGTLVVGTTGSGKTALFMALLWQQLLRGGGAIFVDAKRSLASLSKLIFLCKAAGRSSDLRLIDPRNMDITHYYNPLLRGEAETIANKIIKLIPPPPPGSDASHYHRLAYNAILNLVFAMHKMGRSFNFKDILALLESPNIALPILQRELMAAGLREPLLAIQKFVNRYQKANNQFDMKRAQQDMAGFISELSSITNSGSGEFLCNGHSDVDLYNAIKKSQIVYLMLPRLEEAEKADRLGKVFLADLQATIGSIYGESRTFQLDTPFLILLDEFGSYASPEFAVVFEQGREAGFATVAAIQSLANLSSRERGLSEDFKTRIMSNTRNKIFLTLRDARTAQEASQLFGEQLAHFDFLTEASNRTKTGNWFSAKRLINPWMSKGLTEARGYREAYDYRVRPEVFMHELVQTIGRAVVDIGIGEPVVLDCAWADITLPQDWNMEAAIPRLKPQLKSGLDLAEKVNYVLLKDAEKQFSKGAEDEAARPPAGEPQEQSTAAARRETSAGKPEKPGSKKKQTTRKKKPAKAAKDNDIPPPPPGPAGQADIDPQIEPEAATGFDGDYLVDDPAGSGPGGFGDW
jgi:hypothetical protein